MLGNLLSPVSVDKHLSSSLVHLLLPGSPRATFSVVMAGQQLQKQSVWCPSPGHIVRERREKEKEVDW